MLRNRLLSLDPGETTGYALFDTLTKELLDSGAEKFTHIQLYNQFKLWNPHILLYETFLLYEHKALQQLGSTFYTVEMIAVAKLYSQQNSIPIHTQTAAVGKKIWTDDKLAKFDYSSDNRHARDAIRHGLHYMNVHRLPEVRKRWDDD